MEKDFLKIEKVHDLEREVNIMSERLDQMDNRLKTIEGKVDKILEALVSSINPENGIVYEMKNMKSDINQLKTDFLTRKQTSKVATIVWSVMSSSLSTAIIMAIVAWLFRSKGI